jgi:hypothetical protein
MTTTSRRAILAGIASAPALAAPAIALAAEPDPVFAAIDRHLARDAELHAAHNLSKGGGIKAEQDHQELVSTRDDAQMQALADLLTTRPTTLAGCIALLRRLQDWLDENDDCYPFGEFADPVASAGADFFENLADALEQLQS